MGQGKMQLAQRALKTCEQILKSVSREETTMTVNLTPQDMKKITALTLNNLGCYYKK